MWPSKRWISEYDYEYRRPDFDMNATIRRNITLSASQLQRKAKSLKSKNRSETPDLSEIKTITPEINEGAGWKSEYIAEYVPKNMGDGRYASGKHPDSDILTFTKDITKESQTHDTHSMNATVSHIDRNARTAGKPRHVADINKFYKLEHLCDIAPWDPKSKDPNFKDEPESEYDGEYIDHFPGRKGSPSTLTRHPINPLVEEYDPLKDALDSRSVCSESGEPEDFKDKLSTIYRDDYIDHSKKHLGESFAKGKTRFGTQVNRIRPVSFGNGRDTAGLGMAHLNYSRVRKTIPKNIPTTKKMIKKSLYIKDEGDLLFQNGADNDFTPGSISTIYRDGYVNHFNRERMKPLP